MADRLGGVGLADLFGGVIWRSGLADLFGGPPGSGAGSIRDQSTRLDVITGRFQAGCVGRQQLALSELAPFDWRCQLAVSVGGPVWRCDLAVSVCGGSDLPQDSSASSHAKVAGSRASSESTAFGGVVWRCRLAVSFGGVSWRTCLADSRRGGAGSLRTDKRTLVR